MGQATRNIANSFTTSGVITSSAVNNTTISGITDLALGGSLILISEQTASSDSSISFTTGIDSTYDEYWFIYNFHPGTDVAQLGFQASTNGGSSYGVTMTSTNFNTIHNEAGTDAWQGYSATRDLAQSTSYPLATDGYGNDNDQNGVGIIKLYNPSSTTYVKHFIHTDNCYNANNYSCRSDHAGYFNTTSAINAINFKFNTGNIDAGYIQMFGVK